MSLNRRDFLKITAFAGAAGMGALTLGQLLSIGRLQKISETHLLMGTIINFVVITETEEAAHEAIQKTVLEMRRLIQLYDHRQATSPLGRLNAQGRIRNPPPELIGTLQQALHFGRLTHGAFDITIKPILDVLRQHDIPSHDIKKLVDYRLLIVTEQEISFVQPGMSVTLDGIAKGSVVDGAVSMLQQLGFENVLVEAGGDMMAKGSSNGEAWRIGIAHPRTRQKYIATVSVQDQAITTSGDYMNCFSADYSSFHIIDPRTGRSPEQLASATVIAPSVAEADALSTAMMVLGVQDGLALIEQLPKTAALLVTKEMSIHRSRAFPVEEIE